MFHHVQISVADFGRALRFWRSALEPLGYVAQQVDEAGKSAGFGPPGAPKLWIGEGRSARGPVHLAFDAASHGAIEKFHAAAIASGARDNGAPGPRPDYGAKYWAAFRHRSRRKQCRGRHEHVVTLHKRGERETGGANDFPPRAAIHGARHDEVRCAFRRSAVTLSGDPACRT